jgi:hypothetical protein
MAGIILSIEIDDKGFTKVIRQDADEIKKLFDEMKKGPEAARGPLDNLKESWIGLTAKITAAAAIIYATGRTMNGFVKEAAEAEQIENRLKYTIEGVGYSWKDAKVAVDEFAGSIMKTTRFSDEQARQALNDMFLYTQDYTKAQQGATMAMDLATRKNMDLSSATRFVGMGMTGNVEILGKMLSEFRHLSETLGDNATMSQKSAYFMAEFQKKFGGTTQADISTYSGKVDQMKNSWSDLKKVIGNDFLPVLKETFDWLTKIFRSWKGDELEGLKKDLKNLEAWLAYGIKEGASGKFIEDYINRIEKLKGKIEGISAAKGLPSKPDIFPETKGLTDTQKLIIAGEQELAQTRIDAYAAVYAVQAAEDEEWTKKHAYALDKILEGEKDFDQMREDAWAAVYAIQAAEDDEWVKAHDYALEKIKEGEEEFRKESQEAWEAYNQYLITEDKKNSEMMENFAQNFGSAWNFNIKNIISESKNMGDAVKKVFIGIGDTFTSVVSKMISEWLIFGKYGSGGGLVGWLGGLFPAGGAGAGAGIGLESTGLMMQKGGSFWANRPTLIGVGEGGQREFVTVTPESKMATESKGDTHNYYIDARGAQRGVSAEIMRAIRESENRAVKRSVSTVADYKLRGGKFGHIFE